MPTNTDNDLIHTISGNDVIQAYEGKRKYKEHHGDQGACSCLFWSRYCLFFLNCIVWATGVAMIGLGSWALQEGAGLALFDELLDKPSWFLIGVGVVTVIVGVAGCVISIRLNAWGLRAFMIAVIVLFIVQVVMGAEVFFLLEDVEEDMSDLTRKAVVYYNLDDDTQRDTEMDDLQIEFKCCGGHSFSDWEANIHYSCNSSSSMARCGVPESCCTGSRDTGCGHSVRAATAEYTEMFTYTGGCIEAVLKDVRTQVTIVAALTFSVSFLEIICLVLANIIIKNMVYHRKLLPSIG